VGLRGQAVKAIVCLMLLSQPMHLILLAQGVQLPAVLSSPPASCRASNAVAYGFGRGLRLEHSQTKVTVASFGRDAQVPYVFAGCHHGDSNREFDQAQSKNFVQRLRQAEASPSRHSFGTLGRSFLLTGGMGRLGLHLAGTLSSRDRAHTLLTAYVLRDEPGVGAQLRSLRAAKVSAFVVGCDVAQQTDVLSVLWALGIGAAVPPNATTVDVVRPC